MVDAKKAARTWAHGKPLRALVLEDDDADFALLEDRLSREGFLPQLQRVETEAEYVAHLAPGIDIILSDYTLPGWNALRALELFRASHLPVPFIVVSGTINDQVAVECIKRGAADYLLKDRVGRLGPAIQRAIEEMAARRLTESLSSRLLKAHEEERKRISRELHDQVGQTLASLLLELHSLRSEVPPEGKALARVRRLEEMAEESCLVVRDMARLLRPAILDDLGLVPALNWQAREVSRRSGMEITVHADDTCNLFPDAYRICIYRVTQETLNNATRHAKAAHVHITLRQEAAQIRLEIRDDGRGFDSRHQKGVGLLGMEERVRCLGGAIHIVSKEGSGACISVLLPAPYTDTEIADENLAAVG